MKCFESIDDDYKGEANSIQIRLLIRRPCIYKDAWS